MARSSLPALRHPIQITKESLGIQTRKSILYLDQNFFSSLYRGGNPQWKSAMERITELLDLQLVAIPYSPTHEAEADFYKDRDDLVKFIYGLSRGLRFEPYYQIEETQILKAFQAYLANAPAAYVKEERDALPSRVHEWDGPYCVSVFRRASDVERKLGFKQQAVEELVATLGQWAASKNTFEQDMALELSDSARIFMQSYDRKATRLRRFDFAAITGSPVNASVVEMMLYVLSLEKMSADAARIVNAFFRSEHFANVPSQQLSARLYSAFKKRIRTGAYPDPDKAREKLSGFLFDVQHASTYVPYCDAYFTDKFMADLLKDKQVDAGGTFGCKVFSVTKTEEFFCWLEDVKLRMTADHADGLGCVYPKYRSFIGRS
jgi:hypothetical protein